MIFCCYSPTPMFGLGHYRSIASTSKFFSSTPVQSKGTATSIKHSTTSLLKSSEGCASHPSKHVTFDLHPTKSFFKAFFQGTELGETLKKMLLSKAVPDGLKDVECDRSWGILPFAIFWRRTQCRRRWRPNTGQLV